MSESEQEYSSPVQRRTNTIRTKSRHQLPTRKASTSDFEQGYAANIAPRYLTHSRRTQTAQNGSRIPGPVGPAFESRESSRRGSPEKRPTKGKRAEVRFSRPSSPSRAKAQTPLGKSSKARAPSRLKDKLPTRPPSSIASKSTLRRPPSGPGTKVSNIAKHFERLGRDAERSKSRYAVIRGKRARPVASARAKVEVFGSVKDAIKDDESESSDSSSEADDEGDGNEEARSSVSLTLQSSPDSNPASPEIKTAPPLASFPSNDAEPTTGTDTATKLQPPPDPVSLPPSPFLTSEKPKQDLALTPPTSDIELGPERNSILKALSGLWLQPIRNSLEADDPMSDPEHIFRDSSMVVRIDEPTSIIALALK
jgi:1-phosphatidylinositol-3-phosphate 5-kinase